MEEEKYIRARWRTVPEAIAEIKAKDPKTKMSRAKLYRWVKECQLNKWPYKNGFLINMNEVYDLLDKPPEMIPKGMTPINC